MIENATTHAIAMNLIIQSVGTAIMGIINWLKAFFSAPYAGSILVAILILATIFVGWWTKRMHKRSDFYNRFQQVYDKLLIPGEVKLVYGIGNKLKYTQEEHQEWKGFIDEVNKQIKCKWLKYKARGLYEKVEKAFDKYEEYRMSSYQKPTLLFSDTLKKEGLNFMIWDGEGDQPLEDYVEIERIPYSIENTIKGNTLEVGHSGDERYTLKCPGRIAKATSKDKIEKLRELFQSIVSNEEIKELFAKRDGTKDDADELLKRYNKNLAKVIQDLRFCHW